MLEAIVLGIVQGLTEFLPISSTGHLRIVPAFLGWEDPGAAFTAVTQLGTMAAVLLYFRTDLQRIARAWWRSLREPELRRQLDARLGWYILLGTIPIGIFGLVFKDQIETGARDLYLIGTALIVLGLVLLLAEQVGTRERTIEDLNAARRVRDRVRPGAGADPRRLALGRHDHRGAVHGARPHRGGALLVPALDPRGRAERAARARLDPERRGGPAHLAVPARGGHAAGVHHRLRVDRVAAALPRAPLHGRVRDLPGGARQPRADPRVSAGTIQ